MKTDIAGLNIDFISKQQFIKKVQELFKAGQKTWVTTIYSEFLYHSIKDKKVQELLNRASIALPDGIAMFWARKFLSSPIRSKNYHWKILESLWEAISSLSQIIFKRESLFNPGEEKIPGSELVWDLSELAAKNNYSIYLLGGFGEVPKLTAAALISRYPSLLNKVFYSNKNPNDPTAVADIQKANPDFLFVAYGPINQEKWISGNIDKLKIKLAVGLGGTFDYIAGVKQSPPQWVRKSGFEWLWRLVTQPQRLGRIFNATFGLIWYLILYKVQTTLPYRKNVAVVILNHENKIFIGERILRKGEEKVAHWQLPQGGIDKGEDLISAAKREAYEETGIKSLEYITTSAQTYAYDWYPGYSRKIRGQSQSIVYFKFTGNNEEINLNAHSPEFKNYKWVKPEELSSLVYEYRKPMAKIVEADLKNLS